MESEQIISIRELAEQMGINSHTLRTYLGHYSFNSFRTIAQGYKNKRCTGFVYNKEFLQALQNYLTLTKGKLYTKRIFTLMKEYKERKTQQWWKSKKT